MIFTAAAVVTGSLRQQLYLVRILTASYVQTATAVRSHTQLLIAAWYRSLYFIMRVLLCMSYVQDAYIAFISAQ